MFDLLGEYTFWTVALGTMCLAAAASMIGTISVLTKQSMIGDSLGHAAYPGVILSFMIFQSRSPLLLLLGAVTAGYASYSLVGWIRQQSKHSLSNILALVSASFFGLGMVLQLYVQGNEAFSGASQAGLQTYLFGQAAFIQREDIFLIVGVSGLSLLVFFFYYRSFQLYLFDPVFAGLVGVRVRLLRHLSMFAMMSLIAVGLKVVGAVLMSSFLVAPAVFGLLLGRTYPRVLLLAVFSSLISALVGTWASSILSGLSTGPAIIITMTLFVFSAFVYQTYIRKENGRV